MALIHFFAKKQAGLVRVSGSWSELYGVCVCVYVCVCGGGMSATTETWYNGVVQTQNRKAKQSWFIAKFMDTQL
jgi:hypothetical protein